MCRGSEQATLWNLGTSINISSKTQEQEATQGNNLETIFWMENLTQG